MHWISMRRIVISLLSPLLATALSVPAAGGEQKGPPHETLRALVVTGGHGFDPSFWNVFRAPGLEITKVDQGATKRSFLAGDVKGYDAIVFYDMWQKITGEEKKKFLDLLEEGQGLVVLHHAMATYADWPQWARIMGGKFFIKPTLWEGAQRNTSTYKHGVKFRVHIEDPYHPVTRGLQDFEIVDETYKSCWIDPGARPLLTTTEATSDRVIGWWKTHGNSRVVYIQLGHGGSGNEPSAFNNPSYKKLISQAIRWVAGPAGIRRPVKLFNGRDLAGWEATGNADWAVKDGILIGKQGPGRAAGDLFTVAEYGDFELKATFQVVWPANSGIWFRYVSGAQSYQADILEYKNPRCWTGSIYRPGKMFISMNTDPATVHREGWNTMIIHARGDEMKIELNGKKVAQAKDTLSYWGKIGIQIHAGDQFEPMEIRVKELVLTGN